MFGARSLLNLGARMITRAPQPRVMLVPRLPSYEFSLMSQFLFFNSDKPHLC